MWLPIWLEAGQFSLDVWLIFNWIILNFCDMQFGTGDFDAWWVLDVIVIADFQSC